MDLEQNRKCKKCGEIKNLSLFVNAKRCKFGKSWVCLDCSHKEHREYGKNNNEASKKRYKKYAELNRDKINKRRRKLRLKNVEESRAKGRKEYSNNKEKRILSQKKYRAKNKDKIAAYNKKYKLENPEKVKEIKENNRERQNELSRIRHKTDPKWKLQRTISNYIYQSLCGRKLGKHWEDLVGYNVDELKEHLEKQFIKGMTWENHGDWHIDHKIPIAVFNYTKPEHEDFKKCWALDNLQPLWAKDNLIKHSRLDKPFQPSLQM